MVLKISEKIALHLYEKGYIEEDAIKIYKYGYSIIIDGIVDFTILFTAGLLIHKILEVCVFEIVFCVLRQFTGGYHADSRLKCILLSLSICLISVLEPSFVPAGMERIFTYLGAVLGAMVIILKSPIENKEKKKMSDTLVEKNKQKSIRISVILLILIFGFSIRFVTFAAVASNAMLMVALLIMLALLKQEKN